MRNGTTPTLRFTFPSDFPMDFDDLTITIQRKNTTIKFGIDDVEITDNVIEVTLTQEQTLSLDPAGAADIQLKIKKGDKVSATTVAHIPVTEILDEEVME